MTQPRFVPEGYVAMPSDITIPLTPEQIQALFPNPGAWRQVVEIVLRQDAEATLTASCLQETS